MGLLADEGGSGGGGGSRDGGGRLAAARSPTPEAADATTPPAGIGALTAGRDEVPPASEDAAGAAPEPGDRLASKANSTRRARLASLARLSSSLLRSASCTAVPAGRLGAEEDAADCFSTGGWVRRPWTLVQPSPPLSVLAVTTAAAAARPSPREAEACGGAAATVGGATGAASAAGTPPAATTVKPNDFRSCTSWTALIWSKVVLLDSGACAFAF